MSFNKPVSQMIMRIQRLILISIALWQVVAASDEDRMRGISSDGIETDFDTNALLTEKQIAIVVDLVRQCGMQSVGQIRTYNYLALTSGTRYVINIVSRAVTNGRELKYSRFTVSCEKWNPGGRKGREILGREILKSSGDFWIEDKVDVYRFAIFAAHCGPIRVHLDDSIPLSTADKVVAAMDTGKLLWKDADIKARFDESVRNSAVVISQPKSISLDKSGKCRIALPIPSKTHGMSLVCTLDADGEVTVVDFGSWFI